MGKSADLKINVTADTKQATKGLGDVSKNIKDVGGQASGGRGISSLVSSFGGAAVAIAATTVAIKAAVKIAKELYEEYDKDVTAQTKMESALKATQYAAGLSVAQMADLADSYNKVTNFGGDEILTVEQILIQTNKVSKDTMPRAVAATLDLATAMGTDASTAAQTLGRALADPANNMDALRRSGIYFNDSEVEVIKNLSASGNVLAAQDEILKKLSGTIGGMAEDVAKTDVGKIKQIGDVMGSIKSGLGEAIISGVSPAISAVLKMLQSIDKWIAEKNSSRETKSLQKDVTAYIKGGNDGTLPTLTSEKWQSVGEAYKQNLIDLFDHSLVAMFPEEGADVVNMSDMDEKATRIAKLLQDRIDMYGVDAFGKRDTNTINTLIKGIALSSQQQQETEIKTAEDFLDQINGKSDSGTGTADAPKKKYANASDFVSQNASASATYQQDQKKKGLQDLIDTAEKYINKLEGEAGSGKTIDYLNEMVDGWVKERDAIGKTSDQLIVLSDYIDKNASLSNTAQIDAVNNQQKIVDKLLQTNDLTDAQKKILQEMSNTLFNQRIKLTITTVVDDKNISQFLNDNQIEQTYAEQIASLKKTISEARSYQASASTAQDNGVSYNKASQIAANAEKELLKAEAEEAAKPWQKAQAALQTYGTAAVNVLSGITNLMSQLWQNSIDSEEAALSELQSNWATEKEDLEDSTDSQLTSLDMAYANGLVSLEEYNEQSQAIYQNKIDEIKAEAEAEEAAQEKINELKRKQFEAEKANSLAEALLNGALGITQIWADASLTTAAKWAMTGLEAAQIALQTATISAQQYTAMATGGIVTEPTHILAGEAGAEAIVPLDSQDAEDYGIGGKKVVNNYIYVQNAYTQEDLGEVVVNAIEQSERTGRTHLKDAIA